VYKVFYNLLAGFCMGLAEITPGISGATIAGIFNVYKDFLASLSSFNPQLLKKGFRQFIANLNLSFMAPLLIGMSVAIVLAANVINYLIVGFLYELKVFLSLLMVFAVVKNLFFDHEFKKIKNFFLSFLAGVLVASFILPGISGSLVFLMLGAYQLIISAIVALDVLALLPVLLGMLFSFLLLPKAIVERFEENSERTIMFFSGLIFGSIPAVWLHLHT
jgi:putative membrane protein